MKTSRNHLTESFRSNAILDSDEAIDDELTEAGVQAIEGAMETYADEKLTEYKEKLKLREVKY